MDVKFLPNIERDLHSKSQPTNQAYLQSGDNGQFREVLPLRRARILNIMALQIHSRSLLANTTQPLTADNAAPNTGTPRVPRSVDARVLVQASG